MNFFDNASCLRYPIIVTVELKNTTQKLVPNSNIFF